MVHRDQFILVIENGEADRQDVGYVLRGEIFIESESHVIPADAAGDTSPDPKYQTLLYGSWNL